MNQKGFTLLELTVVVMLISIVAGFALPGFTAVIRDNQLRSSANDFFSLVRYARAEAIRSGLPVAINQVDASWANGAEVVRAGEVLRVVSPRGNLQITETQNNATSLVFNGKGYLVGRVLFQFCDGRAASAARTVEVLASGFATVRSRAGC